MESQSELTTAQNTDSHLGKSIDVGGDVAFLCDVGTQYRLESVSDTATLCSVDTASSSGEKLKVRFQT